MTTPCTSPAHLDPATCTACGTCPRAALSLESGGATLEPRPPARSRGGVTPISLGLSFRTAPVEFRERVALSPAALSALLARFGCGWAVRPEGLEELVVISTCNRFELYAASTMADASSLLELLAEVTGVGAAELAGHTESRVGESAVEHLFRVAAGLDSMVLGEAQILGQVTQAFGNASAHGAAGPVLSELFRDAIRTGRRARSETAINRNPATISSVAVKLAAEGIADMSRARVTVVGAGEMAELSLQAFRDRGVTAITVVNRTLANAAPLADRFGAATLTFERLEEALAGADIVVSSTAAPHFVITREVAERAMRGRAGRPLHLIDIALPRDVDPAVEAIPGITCHDIDALQGHVQQTLAERTAEVPKVEAIVAEEVEDYVSWLRQLVVTPLIVEVRQHAEEIRREAMEKALRQFANLEEKDRKRIEAFSQAFMQKLLHEPTIRLKQQAASGHASEYAAAMRQIFGLAS
ncbi:MAG TPA: glutamyl-tRNA reductase [Gemmatimonadaceae bacterium]